MADVALMLGDEEVGRLYCEKTDNKIMVIASCPYDDGHIYRVYVSSPGRSEDLYLGVMMPQGRRFVLHKEIRSSSLPDIGDIKAYIRCSGMGEDISSPLPFGFSRFSPVEFFSNGGSEIMTEAIRRCGGLTASFAGKQYYAVEGTPGRELPLTDMFCLLTYIEYKSRGYWIFCVDENGRPMPVE